MQRLEQLLARYTEAADPGARAQITRELWETYGRRVAVFISDLSGFSRRTRQHGIVHFLAVIHRCRGLLRPIVVEQGGTLIKMAADNIYAVFPSAGAAIEASVEMQRAVRRDNADRPEDLQIGLCIGVGYGDILVLGDENFYGDQLNLAFKLGEDVAGAGEVLVTLEALDAAGPQRFSHHRRTVRISDVSIPHVAVDY